ncbi:hypothetical protein OROHE_004510 [Orobanche hederae]
MADLELVELHRNSKNWGKLVEEFARIEKRIFPKHESLANSFEEEAKKKKSGLIYSQIGGGDVAGYVMYFWSSLLCAWITKLADLRRTAGGKAMGRHCLKQPSINARLETSNAYHFTWILQG